MNRLRKLSIITINCCLIFSACTDKSGERLVNNKGNYSINKLSDWDYEIKNRSIMISQIRRYDSLSVTGTLIVAPGNSDLPSLDDTFTAFKNDLPRTLKDYQKINEGYSEINGHPTRWIKLSYTLYNFKYISLRYFMQLSEKTPVMIDCSSIDGTFEDFEEDFNEMVFSLRVEI
jgi:hypothetical protein